MAPSAACGLHLHLEVLFHPVYLLVGCFCVQSSSSLCQPNAFLITFCKTCITKVFSIFLNTNFFGQYFFLMFLQLEVVQFGGKRRGRFTWGKLKILTPTKFEVWVTHLLPRVMQVLLLSCVPASMFSSSLMWIFPSRSVLAVTAGLWECWTPTGWERIPHTSFSKWSWSTPSTRPSGATPTRSGSPSLSTSTGRCVAWRPPGGRAAVWARATNSITPSVARAALPGSDATPCSCTATASSCKHRDLIKLSGFLNLTQQCFCCFLSYAEKCRALREFSCSHILKVLLKMSFGICENSSPRA